LFNLLLPGDVMYRNVALFLLVIAVHSIFAQTTHPLEPQVTENGFITLSLDAFGTNDAAGGYIQVNKPAGATVRAAYLTTATIYGGPQLDNDDISIDGEAVVWDLVISSAISSYNHWADITSLLKPKIDAAAPGLIDLLIVEGPTYISSIDGSILAVIFDDPAQTKQNTVVLFFGAQNVSGDNFYISYAEPISLYDPNFRLDFSLGISYSHQSGQYSIVDVNGARLTTSAGGEDDGVPNQNGGLITVGGIGDLNDNPADPYATSTDYRDDDELYNLIPFVTDGETQTLVYTKNPSNDDNIFFAALTTSMTAVVGEGILLVPVTDTNYVGTVDNLTAKVQNDLGDPISGRKVIFEILSGPHAGYKDSSVTDIDGNAFYSFTGIAVGLDEIIATMVDATGKLISSNRAYHYWKSGTTDGPVADAGPDQRVYVSPSCSASVTLDGTGSYDPDGGDIVSYSWQLPTGGTLVGATPSVTLPIGSHNIVLTVVDEDRDSAKDSVVITVVNRKPRITLPADMTINEGTELRIRVTASDSDGTIPSITATGLPEGAVFTDSGNGAGLLFWSTGCNDHGVYTIMFIAEDCADTSMKPFNLTVTDVNFPPEFIKHDDTTSSENTELRMKIVAVDCDGDNPSVKAVSIPGGATFVDNGDGTGTLRWIPECSDNGYYVMVFEASDGYISVRDTVVVRIIDVNCYPPEITLSDRDITSGTHIPITVAIHTIDRDETIARLEIGDLPAGATITSDGSGNAVFSWTPGALGTYTIKVTAIDEVDPSVRVDTTILITIAYGNFTGPQFLPCSDTIIDENTPLSFVVSAQDPDGSIPEIRKVTLPADAILTDNCDGTARIDWLPDCASNGNHLFTICATDGAFTDTLTVMVTVRDQNCPPVINPITDRNVPYGSTVRFTVSATDPDGEVVPEISVSCDLDGYSFTVPTPGSAVFEWNAMASSGSFTVTFYATDGFLSDTETVVISVNTSGSLYIAAKPSGALIRRSPSGGFAGSHIGTDSAVVTDVPGVYWFSAGAPGYSTKHFAGKIISDTTCSLSVELKPSIQKMIVVADTARFGSTTTPGIDGSIGFVDFDGDGLQDLSVATGKTFSIFPGNDSLKGLKYRTPAINLSVPATLDSIVSHLYTDWDNDGDYECLLSLAGGTVMIAELDNEEIAPGAVVVKRSGETLFPVVVDLDKDNRKDLVLISSGKGVYFYKNNATDSAPAFDTPVKVTDNSGRGITTLKGAALIVDMDGDDSTDLIATGTDFVQLFKNGMGSLSGELPAGEDLNAGGERIKGNSGSIALLPLANSHPGFALLKKGRLLVYRLRLLGDISGDGKVNINDISKIAKAWETTPDNSSWNPACNLRLSPDDGEEIINIGDITRASKAWESEEE